MNVRTENKVVPKLRFREFDTNWNVNKLKELVKINQGLQIPISKRYTKKIKGSYFYITNEFLKANSEKKYFILNPNKSVLCDVNDILMTRTGNTGMVVTNVKGAFHNNFFKIAYPNTIAKDFLFYFLNLASTQNTIKRLAGTSTIPDINHSDFYRINFSFPSLSEQQKIASFLSAVDEKLQQLNKKKDLLEEYKKGIMQQLFSYKKRFNQNGEIRKGTLGDFGFFYYGKGAPKTTIIDGAPTPCVRYGELYSTYKEEIKKIKSYTTVEPKNLKLSKGGEVLVPRVGEDPLDFANCSYLPFSDVAIGEMISVYNTEENGLFMTYYINAMLKKQLAKLVEGGNVSNLYFRYVETIQVKIPNLKEQQKIVNFLSSLDNKIELVSTQIENTKAFKKGLLQQMFV